MYKIADFAKTVKGLNERLSFQVFSHSYGIRHTMRKTIKRHGQ